LRREKALIQLSSKEKILHTPTISESNFGDRSFIDQDEQNDKDFLIKKDKLLIKALKKIKNLSQIVELRDQQLKEYKTSNKDLKDKYDNHAIS